MTRPVTLFTGQWADLPLETLAKKAREWGYDGLELACWGDHFEVDSALADSGYCPAFREIRERVGSPDVALLPIGAYEPRWFMKPAHMNPEEAVQTYVDLGARDCLVQFGCGQLAEKGAPQRGRTSGQARADRDVGGHDAVDGRLADAEPAGQVGDPELGVSAGEGPEHPSRVPDRPEPLGVPGRPPFRTRRSR